MPIRTPLTEMFKLDYPIVLAPMGGASGGELAAAVSNAGGLGFIGGAYGDIPWLTKELDLVKASSSRPWGAGLITWKISDEALDLALSYRPAAFFLSFGDPGPYVDRIKAAGCKLICQVQDLEGARQARDAGADLIVAQGTEAGGHGASRSTLPLVPAVIDAVAPIPVIAAGGIADGRGVAAALALGAAGALIGTRFCATKEALLHPDAKQRLIAAHAQDTIRTHVFDEVRDYSWPAPFTGRALRNQFVQEWDGKESAMKGNEPVRKAYRAAQRSGDFDTAVVWAGEVVELVSTISPAAELLRHIGEEAEHELRRVTQLIV